MALTQKRLDKCTVTPVIKMVGKTFIGCNRAAVIDENSKVMEVADNASSEDKQLFLIIGEKKIKSGKHYIVPLPYQNKSLEILNSIRQAMKRLMYWKARFKRNPSFC